MIECLYDQFEYWARTGSVWVVSDTHFGDADCPLMDPDWPDPMELVKQINKKCGRKDTLIHLGDVGDISYIPYLKAGRKVLIKGNHDGGNSLYKRKIDANYVDNRLFDEVYSGPLIVSEKLILSHEPIFGLEEFMFNLHGHDHNGGYYPGHKNVAANAYGYKPFNLGAAIKQGMLSQIKSIHRVTIDLAAENKKEKELNDVN